MTTINSYGLEVAVPASTTLSQALQPTMNRQDRREVKRAESAAAVAITRADLGYVVDSYKDALRQRRDVQAIANTAERGRTAAGCAAGLVEYCEAVAGGDPNKMSLVADIMLTTVDRMKRQI